MKSEYYNFYLLNLVNTKINITYLINLHFNLLVFWRTKKFYRWAIQIDDIRDLNGINYNELRNKRNS